MQSDVDNARYRTQILARLTCGCQVWLRIPPIKDNTKFGCVNGLGHGYSLGWTEWTDTVTGRQGFNRKLSAAKRGE